MSTQVRSLVRVSAIGCFVSSVYCALIAAAEMTALGSPDAAVMLTRNTLALPLIIDFLAVVLTCIPPSPLPRILRIAVLASGSAGLFSFLASALPDPVAASRLLVLLVAVIVSPTSSSSTNLATQSTAFQALSSLTALLSILMSISAFVHYREDTFLYPLKSTDVPTLSKRIFIEDNSRSLFLSCRGGAAIGQHQFTPTILLETGLSLTAVVSWNDTLLGSLSKIGQVSEDSDDVRVCWYDRAGYGWSDSGPMPQTAKRNAMALHSLVESAGEVGPFILVGHSFGGHMIRIFAHYYPEKVAGLVFLDSSHEDDFEATAALFPSKSVADWHGEFRQLAFSTGIVAALGSTFAVADRQLVSVFEKTQGGHSYSGREIAATFRGKFFKALSSELLNFVFVSTSQVRKTVPVSPRMDLPVAVLIATDEVAQYCTPITSAHTIPSSFTNIDMSLPANESGLCVPIRAHSDRAPSLEAALAQSHYQCQWKLATQLSTLSRVLFSTGGHYVMFDDMNAVVRAVEDVFHEAKRIARANAIAWQENTKGEYSFEPDENEL